MQDSAQPHSTKARSFVFLVPAAVLMLLILAASWAPDSRMTQLGWVPRWVAILADRFPNIRTAVPFIPLAFLLVCGLRIRGSKRPLAWTLMLSLACLCLAEFGQIFLPGRTADGWDLLWGGGGVLLGTGAAWLCSGGLRPSSSLAEK
ncbi:MAG: VanZ family protein [Verrucomicrobia bacterium]|nr:VanZ family protein [Verrucomicrobiota bacterium]